MIINRSQRYVTSMKLTRYCVIGDIKNCFYILINGGRRFTSFFILNLINIMKLMRGLY